MKKTFLVLTALVAFCCSANSLFAQTAAPAAAATGSGDVVASLTSSENFTALAIAVRAAGLTSTLEGAGPFTIFAPTNEAIGKLPSAQLDTLVKDQAGLATVLKYHVVSGKYTKADIIKALGASKDRKTTFKTIDGHTLTFAAVAVEGHTRLQLSDDLGNKAFVTSFDVPATNGVIHGLSGVLDLK